MTYVLFLWTTVAMAGDRFGQKIDYDWRPMAEIHSNVSDITAKEMCHQAARELGLKSNMYRCVRTK